MQSVRWLHRAGGSMASPPRNDNGTPVTRAQLREELARYPTREELKETLRQELTRFATKDEFAQLVRTLAEQHEAFHAKFDQLTQVFAQQHEVLLVEIGRTARAAAEEHRRELGVMDDRYRDLPARVTTLERELDEHRLDGALHVRPRRPRRPR